MELELLPTSVYQPSRAEPVSSQMPNTLIKDAPLNTARKGRHASRPPALMLRAPSPRRRSPSPSSSVDSRPVTWISSEGGSTADSGTDIEDLHDPADEELGKDEDFIPVLLVEHPHYDVAPAWRRRGSTGSIENKMEYLSVEIPDLHYLAGRPDQKDDSPVPPTPPPKIPISSAALSLLTRNLPAASSPPSLDGSATSEHQAHTSAPPTPLEQSLAERDTWDGGVELDPEALATLQMLSTDPSRESAETPVATPTRASANSLDATARRPTVDRPTSCVGPALASLARLDIPSPTDFFSSLASGTRRTWCPSAAPPSSTTAERFYQCPWNRPAGRTVERVIEVDDTNTDAPTTAQLITPRPVALSKTAPGSEKATETTEGDILELADQLTPPIATALDRTALWLSEQMDYLGSCGNAEVVDEVLAGNETVVEDVSSVVEGGTDAKDTTLADVFRSLLQKSSAMDAVSHGQPRFDAIQTGRICSPAAHRRQLLGQFKLDYNCELTKDAEDDSTAAALNRAASSEKERAALQQMSAAHWNIAAIKYLSGGKLLTPPAAKLVAKRSTSAAGGAKILDLGGQPVCDWAWHCAMEYPTAQVYTAVLAGPRHPLSSTSTQGPDNHNEVSVSHLWKLPFPDAHFEVISARNLYALLKTDKSAGETPDEYDLCLAECMRCLKPGGYLEFSLLDSELLEAGPLGTAMSVEFGFNLKTRGYDPTPTRSWIGRLRKAGFADLKRSWMFLPLGAPQACTAANADAPLGEESPVVGSTQPIASVTGLVGLRAWESWMLRLQMESGKSDEHLLEGVSSVVQEGRNCRTGWKCLSGWARKPTTA